MTEPLTPEQAELAATCVHLAHWIAARAAESRPWLADEVRGAALDGLLKAAALYSPDCGARFNTWATRLVWQSIDCEVRRCHRGVRDRRREQRYPPRLEVPAPAEPDDAEPGPPPGFAALALSLLPERDAAVVRIVVMEGRTLREAGAHANVSKERARQIVNASLRRLSLHPELAGLA